MKFIKIDDIYYNVFDCRKMIISTSNDGFVFKCFFKDEKIKRDFEQSFKCENETAKYLKNHMQTKIESFLQHIGWPYVFDLKKEIDNWIETQKYEELP